MSKPHSYITSGELINHQYIVYADSLNVINGFKPFKIASRIWHETFKTEWFTATPFKAMSFDSVKEAESVLEEWFNIANKRYRRCVLAEKFYT